MVNIKNKASIRKMEEAGRLLAEIFEELEHFIYPGVSTAEINQWIAKELKNKGLLSSSKGYSGYKYESCISINDELIHGLPSDYKKLKNGDLVKVDVCASWNGYCADMARSFLVGNNVEYRAKALIDVAQVALDEGIKKAWAGNYLSDISNAIQKTVESYGFGVVRDFAGHGIGKNLHEEPEVLNYGEPGRGLVLVPGMAFALEPMITMGSYKVEVMDDGWTVRTIDRSLTAHVEDTIVITDGEPKILTRRCIRNKVAL